MSRTALLTVGTTEFSALVAAFLAPATLAALSTHAVESALVQVGNSQLPSGFALGTTTVQGLTLELVQFVPDIDLRIARATVVVSHAGAGSVLSVLRPALLDGAAAPALVVVPNGSLMDSHQQDLADELRTNGWATVATVDSLAGVISTLLPAATDIASYPAFNAALLPNILDVQCGFL